VINLKIIKIREFLNDGKFGIFKNLNVEIFGIFKVCSFEDFEVLKFWRQ
jgi:hypothetical protein